MGATPTFDESILRHTLRAARERAGKTVDEAAHYAGVHKSTISKLETGKADHARFDVVAKLAQYYGLSLEDLAAESGVPTGKRATAPNAISDARLSAVVTTLQTMRDAEMRDNLISVFYRMVVGTAARRRG